MVVVMPRKAEVIRWLRTELKTPELGYLGRAELYAEAAAKGLSNPEIATAADVTAQAVEQSLLLAGASAELKNFVSAGRIAPSNAVQIVRFCRKHPDHDPVAIARAAIVAARVEGKEKASNKHLPAYVRAPGTASAIELRASLVPLAETIAKLLASKGRRDLKLPITRDQADQLLQLLKPIAGSDQEQ
ncbi:hypothetical protein IPC1038_22695 [Pseudomonas aeruginosa]|nr:hypothetical protein IPC1038_22695 [Pseudomonas aeruginosa]BDF97327.1 hypothetical protein [Pseudomonas aeruginosa]